MEGQRCRKLMLADEAISFLEENLIPTQSSKKIAKCTMDSECDNCMCTNRGRKVDITDCVKTLSSVTKCDTLDWNMYRTNTKKIKKLPSVLTKKTRPDFALHSDFHRYMHLYDLRSFLDLLSKGKLFIYVNNCFTGALPTLCRHWYDVESVGNSNNFSPLQHFKTTEYPFVLCFERDRLGLSLEEVFNNEPPKILSTACEQLFSKTKTRYQPPYLSTLKKAETNHVAITSALFYCAKLNFDGSLQLLEPQRADDKRIYRMYGSDRFLEISMSSNVSKKTIKNFLTGDVIVANRCYKFFWFKREAGVHPVLFAVSGQNIDNVSVEDARNRCIPGDCNLNLSLGKWVKRMKLNFSTTTATCALPPSCVDVLNDCEDDGVAQIDGAGLISSMALQAVWDGYNKRNDSMCHGTDAICRFSGFQGRLAG